jgi:hypothetical protein
MTTHRLYILLLTLLLIASSPALLSQQEGWSLSIGGGSSLPAGPDYFAGQWKMGYGFAGSIEYRMEEGFALGAYVDYSSYRHTGKSLMYRDRSFKCLGGGTRTFSAAGMTMKFYLHNDLGTGIYLSGMFGAVDIDRADVFYHVGNDTMTLPEQSSLNVSGTLAVGIERALTPSLALVAEAGYGIAEDGVFINQFIPITIGVKLSL